MMDLSVYLISFLKGEQLMETSNMLGTAPDDIGYIFVIVIE